MRNKLTVLIVIILFQSYFNLNISFANKITNTDGRKYITIEIDNLKPQKSINYSSIFCEVKVMPLETKKDFLIGNIDKMLIENDLLYVLDILIAKSLFVFDLNGKFIKKIGKLGKGPGEYTSPISFAIDNVNKEINLLDLNKIIVYTIDGKFVRNINLKTNGINEVANENGTLYIDKFPERHNKNSPLLIVYNNIGKNLYNWFPFKQYNHGFTHNMGNYNHLFKTNNDIKYYRPFFDTIFSIKNQKFYPHIVFNTKHQVTNNEIEKINKIPLLKLSSHFRNSHYFLGPKSYTENENLIFFMIAASELSCFGLINPKSQKKIFTATLNDDFINSKYSTFLTIKDDCFISSTDHFFTTESLISNVINGNTKLNNLEKEKIMKLKPGCNPVILFYKCRENIIL